VVGTRAKGDVMGPGRSRRRLEHAGFVRTVAVVGHVVRTLFVSRQRPALDIHAKKALVSFD
jgi:hypothetical protein